VGLGALRLFLAVADGLDGVGADATLDQGLAGGVGAALTQGQVVLGGAALVTVAFDLYAPALLLDELCGARQHLLSVRTQIGFVIVEEDVCDVLGEELIVRDRRRSWLGSGRGRRLGRDRNRRGGFLRSTRTLGGQVIRGGLCGRDRLRAAGIDFVAVQGDVGRVFRAPRERGRLAGLNGGRVSGKCCRGRFGRWRRGGGCFLFFTATDQQQNGQAPQD